MKKLGSIVIVTVLIASMLLPMIAIHIFGDRLGLDRQSFSVDHFRDFNGFIISLKTPDSPLSEYLKSQLQEPTRGLLDKYNESNISQERLQVALVEELNILLNGKSLYNKMRFEEISLSSETRKLVTLKPQGRELVRLNRLLLEDAYPLQISKIQGRAPAEITVGLIVILRATFRRLLRGFSTNVLQTTIGTFGRTSARAVTRRFVRFVGRVLFGSTMQKEEKRNRGVKEEKKASPFWQLLSLTVGFIGLCLSFCGILQIIPPDTKDSLIGAKGLSELDAVLMAGAPLLIYAFLHKTFGRRLGVNTTYRTEIDGLFLQAYFTGAGSFLPMTTDVEYGGDKRTHFKLASCALIGMFGCFGICYVAGLLFKAAHLNFVGSMILIYCFVYCFPIKPLEGHIIWAHSKRLWLAIAIPILLAFAGCMDTAFGDIL